MSRIAQRQDTEHDPPLVRRESTDGITGDVTSIWPDPSLPTSPREQRRIRNQLIVLALAGLVAYFISLMSR